MPTKTRILVGASVLAVSGCQLLLALDFGPDAGSDGSDATSDAEPVTSDTGPDVDAADIVDSDLPRPDDAGCPSGRGPAMVRIAAQVDFCIDSTEVTKGQYAAFFMEFLDSGTSDLPSTCAWKEAPPRHEPRASWPFDTAHLDRPIEQVDWCDAYAFCRWSGKRLCGAIGDGGPLDDVTATSAYSSEWLAVCTGNATRAFPYGGTYEVGACNIGGDAGTVPVGSFAGCEGSFPGVYDLIGNVWEWVNWCRPNTIDAGPDADTCFDYGGAHNTSPTQAPNSRCTYTGNGPRATRNIQTGFRCCADVAPDPLTDSAAPD